MVFLLSIDLVFTLHFPAVSETIKWVLTPEEMAEREGRLEQHEDDKEEQKEADKRESIARNASNTVTTAIETTLRATAQVGMQEIAQSLSIPSENRPKGARVKGKDKEGEQAKSKGKDLEASQQKVEGGPVDNGKSKRKQKPKRKPSKSSAVASGVDSTITTKPVVLDIPALALAASAPPTDSHTPYSSSEDAAMASEKFVDRSSVDERSARGSPPRASTADVITDSASVYSSPLRSPSSRAASSRFTPLVSPPRGISQSSPAPLCTTDNKRKHEMTDDEEESSTKRAREVHPSAPTRTRRVARTGGSSVSNVVISMEPGSSNNPLSELSSVPFPSKPLEAPSYVEKVLEICESVSEKKVEMDAKWNGFIKVWLDREVKAKYAGGKFVTKGRPGEVGRWIQCARPTKSFKPAISLSSFTVSFAIWWDNMQPEGRIRDEDLFMGYSREGEWTWDKLVFGVNGAVNVVVALAWWRRVVYDMKPKGYREEELAKVEQEKFEQALDEVCYVFNCKT